MARVSTPHRPLPSSNDLWRTSCGKGWPDVVLVGPGGALLRELKSERGVLSAEQQAWLGWLTDAGLDAGVWKPRDWRSGRIEQELRAISRTKSREVG